MLAEIFFLQLEATLRANNEVSARAPKFVAFDFTIVPGLKQTPHHIAAQPLGRVCSVGCLCWFMIPFDIAFEFASNGAIVFNRLA